MKPYGLEHDGHQYLLNDNDKRDAVFAKRARSRERLRARGQIREELPVRCVACGDDDRDVCGC